jgi:lipoate---protein ligase
MLCLHLQENDPYFCLATEEYLLTDSEEDFFILWQSRDAVVAGKHQNLLGEINYPWCRQNNVLPARRISGGGTVFHDEGNINFSFLRKVDNPAAIRFEMFVQPVIHALEELGFHAVISGKNDLLIQGKKISGNAQHIYKNRILHHGTLLFDTNLEKLRKALHTVPGKYQSKGVPSHPGDVANLLSFLKRKINRKEFIRFLFRSQLQKPSAKEYVLTADDKAKIRLRMKEKFSTWEWIFGYSPAYSFRNRIACGGKQLNVELEVQKGIIQQCKVSGKGYSEMDLLALQNQFPGEKHDYTDLYDLLQHTGEVVPSPLTEAFF